MNKAIKIGLLCSLVVVGFGAVYLWGSSNYGERNQAEQHMDTAEEKTANVNVKEDTVSKEQDENVKETVKNVIGKVAFDTDFTLKPGQGICVGQEDIFVEMLDCSYDAEYFWFSYKLTIGDQVFEGEGGGSETVGCTITQKEFTKNRIVYVSGNDVDGMTLQLTADTVAPSPLVISGNAADEYVTTKPEYIVADDFILFLDKDMKVKGDIMKQIEQIFGLVEQETGLKFKNDSVYASKVGYDDQWLYDNAFAGVDPKCEKFHIYAVADEKSSPCSMTKAIILNQTDLNVAEGEGMAIVHELVHSVHSANGVMMNSIMTEGYATYITGQITKKSKDIPFNFDADVNYGYYDVVITPENAEEEFLKEYDDGWNYYLYGYRFMTFLYETYGEDIFRNILTDATESAGAFNDMVESEELIPIIKKNTSDTVFEEFATWLSKTGM